MSSRLCPFFLSEPMTEKLVTFAHISDTHLHADRNYVNDLIDFPAYPRVRALLDYLNNLDAGIDLVIHSGDVMHDPSAPEEYTAVREILDTLRYPVHYIPGNHDHVAWMQSHFMGRPQASMDSEFEVNGVQFILLDSHTPEDIHSGVGVLSYGQLQWVDTLCRADDERPLVVVTHHQPLPILAPWLDRIALTNGADLHQILLQARHRLRGVFYGHIHETVVTIRDGISYFSVHSGWYQTQTWHNQQEPALALLHYPGFNLVTLTAQDSFVRVVRVPF
jgi:3',5'-cyclic-AMP phosphodiesterase